MKNCVRIWLVNAIGGAAYSENLERCAELIDYRQTKRGAIDSPLISPP
jgi:hypothetical protein